MVGVNCLKYGYALALTHLVLETVKDFPEHVLQIGLWVEPAGHGVTEEDEVRHHASGVRRDHLAHPAERRVLLVVVTDIPEAGAPGPDELLEAGRHDRRADQPHPADRDRSVLQQGLRRVRPVDDGDEGVEDCGDVARHVVTQLHRYFACGPGGVVAHRDILRVEVPWWRRVGGARMHLTHLRGWA